MDRLNIKICIITPYFTPIKGGITTYLFNLVSYLNKSQIPVFVITRFGAPDRKTYLVNTNKIFFILKSYIILKNERPSVIHANSNWYTLSAAILYKLIHTNVKVIFSFHTEPLDKIKGHKKSIFQWLLSKCDVVTFVSQALLEKITSNLKIISPMKIIYAGAEVKKTNPDEIDQFISKFLLKSAKPIVSFVGPLVWKMKVEGIKKLICAFKIVVEKYPNSRLLIIGDGIYKKDLEKLIQDQNIEKKAIITGFVENVFIPLSITDIYAHISLQEGFPISILEAMSVGKPIIATKVGGIPEMITHNYNGLLVEAKANIIAREIIQLYEDKEKQEFISKNAILTVSEKYSWDLITNQFIEIYSGLNNI